MIIKFHLKRLGAAIASTLGLSYSVEAGVMDEYQTGLTKIAEARKSLREAQAEKSAALNTQHVRHVAEIRELRRRHHEEVKELTSVHNLSLCGHKNTLRHSKDSAALNLRDAFNKAYPKPVVHIPTFRPTPAPANAVMRDVTEAPPIGAVPA